MNEIVEALKNGLIVSCQAREGNPLQGPEYMVAMAEAASLGGAAGIRAEGPRDVAAIKKAIKLPLIGLYKVDHPGFDVYITPTWDEIKTIADAGADIIALDATIQSRPGNNTASDLINRVKKELGLLVMADISTEDEGIAAARAGADFISTTLSGYTPYSRKLVGPDFELIRNLAKSIDVPIIAEGRFWEPGEVVKALKLGVFAVVVGTAITNPWKITERFATKIKQEFRANSRL